MPGAKGEAGPQGRPGPEVSAVFCNIAYLVCEAVVGQMSEDLLKGYFSPVKNLSERVRIVRHGEIHPKGNRSIMIGAVQFQDHVVDQVVHVDEDALLRIAIAVGVSSEQVKVVFVFL